ncbi:hypothetical protein CLDAP_31250 [Caldilinea aerophila DSM 14535 = NBRC 104270]|uniref:DUF3307 domain-containing protein n=1 Tax=Caldilinea aerophila (strain DSM 14535 / JCM 11387 / NBRC 104270 / STL-6-O1) TaxID=926550 RepID=I0I7C7_CALAS|nr:hypothetical protein CLDAP_31250 [Caldilinea aerophila DSM 14535 = NBRC 104270]
MEPVVKSPIAFLLEAGFAMTLFTWLLIGHLIGDWMLQNDWMARYKRGRWWSLECITHCLIYSLSVLLAAWWGGQEALTFSQLLSSFFLVFVSHWLIDGFNLSGWWGRVINQTQTDFVRIMVDQSMHLIVLGVCVSWIFV